jgi:hypothetical protein
MKTITRLVCLGAASALAFGCGGEESDQPADDMEAVGTASEAITAWKSRELTTNPTVAEPENWPTVAYEVGAPSGPDTDSAPGLDLHFWVVGSGGNVRHSKGGGGIWENWGGVCSKGLDGAVLAPNVPTAACIGTNGEVWYGVKSGSAAVSWGQVSIIDAQSPFRPSITSRGDGSFDVFYITSTNALWHTGWSPDIGWIDEQLLTQATAGVDAAWGTNGTITIAYVDQTTNRAMTRTGAFSASNTASNHIAWASSSVAHDVVGTGWPSVGVWASGTAKNPVVFFTAADGSLRFFEQINTFFFKIWTASQPSGLNWFAGLIPDVAARQAANGSLGRKINVYSSASWHSWAFR